MVFFGLLFCCIKNSQSKGKESNNLAENEKAKQKIAPKADFFYEFV